MKARAVGRDDGVGVQLCFLTDVSLHQRDPETHTKRQATKHDCLPNLLGDRDE